MAENPQLKSLNFPNYFKNVAQSAIYTVGDSFTQEIFPTTHSFLDNNKETIRDTVDSAKNLDAHIKKFNVIVKESEYVDVIKEGFKNLKSDLKTGKWNNQKRVRSTGIEGMDDFGFMMDDFSTGVSSSVLSGTKSVTDTMKSTSKVTSDIMTGLTGQTVGAIGESTATLNAILEHHNNNISPFLKEATKYFTDSMKVQTDMNDTLKKGFDLQSQYYQTTLGDFNKEAKAPKQSDLDKVLNFDDTANMKEYFDVVKKNINKLYMDNGGAMLGVTGEKDGFKALLKTIAENPVNFAIQQSGVAQKIVPKSIKESGKKFDDSLKGFFSSALLKFNELAEGKNQGDNKDSLFGGALGGLSKIFGKAFGIDTGFKTNVKTSDYIKGSIPFDGVTKKAITDVIPMYLRKILSVLSGKEEILYNYDEGKAESKKRVKERYDMELGNAGLYQYQDYKNKMLSRGKESGVYSKDNEKDVKTSLDDTLKKLRGKKLPIEDKQRFLAFLEEEGISNDPQMKNTIYSLFASLDNQERMNFSNASIRAAKEATTVAKGMEEKQGMNSYAQLLSDTNINGISRNNTVFGNLELANEKIFSAVIEIKNLISDTNNLLRRGIVVYPVKNSEGRTEAIKDARVIQPTTTTSETVTLGLDTNVNVENETKKEETKNSSVSPIVLPEDEKKNMFSNIRDNLSKVLERPIELATKGLDKASFQLYKLIFGGKDNKTGKEVKSMQEVLDGIGKSITDKITNMKEKLFGKKDDDNNLIVEGFFTPALNSAKDSFSKISYSFTGSETTLSDGTVLAENPQSINAKVKAVFSSAGQSVKETLFGIKNVSEDGVVSVEKEGMLTSIKNTALKPFEKAKEYLLGSTDVEGNMTNGTISKELQDKIKQVAPKATLGGLAGGAIGLLAPGGPLVGAAIGSVLSVSGAGAKFKEFMLGKKDEKGNIIDDNGVLNADIQAKIKKLVPVGTGAGMGALLGGVLTGGGIVGIVGAGAVGAMSQMESVKGYLFGDQDPETGKRSGGLMGKLETHMKHNVIRPLEVQMRQGALQAKKWFTDKALNPLQDAVAPLKAEMTEVAKRLKEKGQDMWDGVLTKLGGTFDNYVGKPMKEFFDDKFFNPMKKAFGKMMKGVGDVLAAPFKALGTYTDGLKQKHQNDANYDSSYIDSEEKRIAERNKAQQEKYDAEQAKINKLKEGYEDEAKIAGAANIFDSSVNSFQDAVNSFGKTLLGMSGNNKDKSFNKQYLKALEEKGIDLSAIDGNDIEDFLFNNTGMKDAKKSMANMSRTDQRRLINESINKTIGQFGSADNLKNAYENDYIEYLYGSGSNNSAISIPTSGGQGNAMNPSLNSKFKLGMGKGSFRRKGDTSSSTSTTKVESPIDETSGNKKVSIVDKLNNALLEAKAKNLVATQQREMAKGTVGKTNTKASQQSKEAVKGTSIVESEGSEIQYGRGTSAKKVVKKTKDKVVGKINLSKLGDNIDAIRREVDGQLDGVGYNVSAIKNILARQFGDAEGDTGKLGSRGNSKRKGFFGRMKDKALNPFRKGKDRAETFMTSIKEKIMSPIDMLNKGLEFVGNKVMSVASAAGNAMKSVLEMAGNAISSVVKGAWTVTKEVSSALWGVAKEVGPAIYTGMKDVAKGAWTIVTDVASGLGSVIKETTKGLYTLGKDLIKGVANVGSKVLGGLWNGIKGVAGGTKDFVVNRFNKKKAKKQQKTVYKESYIRGGYLDHTEEMMNILRNPLDVRIVESITLPISESSPVVPDKLDLSKTPIKTDKVMETGSAAKGSAANQKQQESLETKGEMEVSNTSNLNVIAEATSTTNSIMAGLTKKSGLFSTLSKFALLAIPFLKKGFGLVKGIFGKKGIKGVASFLLKGIKNIMPKGIAKGILGLTSGIKLLTKGIVALPKTLFNLFTGKKGVKDIFSDIKDSFGKEGKKNKDKLNKYGNRDSMDDLARDVLEDGIEGKASKKVAKEVTENATEKVAKEGAEKVGKTVIAEGTEKASKTVAKEVTEKGAKTVTKSAGNKVIDSLIKNIDKVLKSKAVTAVIGKEASEKVIKVFLPKLTKEIMKNSAKIVGGLSTGGIINAAFFVGDLVSGFNKAHDIFGVSKGESSFGMKVAAGLSKAISGLVFGIVPESWMAEEIYKLFSSKKSEEKLKEKQEAHAQGTEDGVIEEKDSSGGFAKIAGIGATIGVAGGISLLGKKKKGKKKKSSTSSKVSSDIKEGKVNLKKGNTDDVSPMDLMLSQAGTSADINETLNVGIGGMLKGILDSITSSGSATVEMLGEVIGAIGEIQVGGSTPVDVSSPTGGPSRRSSSSSASTTNKKTSLMSKIGSAAKAATNKVKSFFGKGGEDGYNGGAVKANDFTYYNQNDPRWANESMSVNGDGDTVGSAGCGPTAAAMALSAYGKNVDPRTASKYAVDNGYKVQGEGVDAAFVGDFAKEQGINLNAKMKGNHSQTDIDKALSQGKPILTLGRSSNSSTNPYTNDGHYVMITGKDGNGKYKVNDPLNSTNNNRSFSADELLKNTDVMWSEDGVNDTLPTGLEGEGAGATGKFTHPTPNNKKVTSPYGNRIHPISKTPKMHSGIDLSAGSGVPILASDGGTIKESRVIGSYGNVVYIDHGNGFESRYAHASKLIAQKGQKVSQGQEIAKVGSTGGSTGPHLHFEIRKNGDPTNPEPLLNGDPVGTGVASNLDPNDFLNGMVYYSQGDDRWGAQAYGSGTMKSSSCGPTSMAMVASTAMGRNILPTETAKWALDNGHRVGAGTSHDFFPKYAKTLGLDMPSSWSKKDAIKAALGNKQPVILSGNGAPPFTNGGHFVVATHTDGENVYINDPVNRARSISYNYDTIIKQSKNAWISPKSNTGVTPGGDGTNPGGSEAGAEPENKLTALLSESTNFLSAMITGDKGYLNQGNAATGGATGGANALGTPSKISGIPMGTKQLADGVTSNKAHFDKAEQEFGVESEILQAIAMQESGGNPNIQKAAWGLMQIENGGTTNEFINFGKSRPDGPYNSNDRLVPAKAIPFAAKRLSDDVRHYNNDYAKSIQAYNFSKYSLDKLVSAFPTDWMSQRKNIAKYNGHYNRTGKMSYGDPEYIEHVMRYYHGDALKGGATESANATGSGNRSKLTNLTGRGTKSSAPKTVQPTTVKMTQPTVKPASTSHVSNTSMQLEALEKIQGNVASNNTISPTINNNISGSDSNTLAMLARIAELLETLNASNNSIAVSTDELKNKDFNIVNVNGDTKANNSNKDESSNIFLGSNNDLAKTTDAFLTKVNKIALGD